MVKTLGGGTELLFQMARNMLVWQQDGTEKLSDGTKPSTITQEPVLPRWHPYSGVSDVNPSFRTRAPRMNAQGYAGTIWRNVRKHNKPSLWRHALRTYHRMESTEDLERMNVHYEGALLACAKLGLLEEALQIYATVEETAVALAKNQTATPVTSTATNRRRPNQVFVTESMVLSVVSASVRGSKRLARDPSTTLQERRVPLDRAYAILRYIPQRHGIPLVAHILNPLAAAYQNLGLLPESSHLLQKHLHDRTIGPEPEDGEPCRLNINNFCAKDKASYALLVKGAVSTGDWKSAVQALGNMTESGLYPKARHLNAWTEVSERKSKQRTTRSRKKKRDEYWLESVR